MAGAGVDSTGGGNDDGTGAGEDGANAGAGLPGMQSSPEANVFSAVEKVLDAAVPMMVLENVLSKRNVDSARLLHHIACLFASNTESGTASKHADWSMFLTIVYDGRVPPLEKVAWPPVVTDWLKFLVDARTRVSSYKRFQCVVGNVCVFANRYFSGKLGVAVRDVDPRLVHEAEHGRAMGAIKREHGLAINQVAPVTMNEARNATHYGDVYSVRGVTACAAFCLGVLCGGRRPRTLTSILLRDVTLRVGKVELDGEVVKVPVMHVVFTQEKFDDFQGPRHAQDTVYREQYRELMWSSMAFWVYRLLVMRGVLVGDDPIWDVEVGATLQIRSECLDFYLFCEVRANWWLDTAPSSVGAISHWNRMLLRNMGSPARGFSAHRSGCVSRACILALLDAKGKKLSRSMVDVMVRWGGWQAETGAKTVLRVYARPVIDAFMCGYSMSLGVEPSDAEWLERKREYLGKLHFPEIEMRDHGRSNLPFIIRMHAWRSVEWTVFQADLNIAAAKVVGLGREDASIMPIHRYREDRRVLNLCKRKHGSHADVLNLNRLRGQRKSVMAACLKRACQDCELQFAHALPDKYLGGGSWLRGLAVKHIGCVSLKGNVVEQRMQAGEFAWT